MINILSLCLSGNVELLGGWTDANPEREDVQEAAKEAVEQFNSKSRAKKYFKLINITSARTQVHRLSRVLTVHVCFKCIVITLNNTDISVQVTNRINYKIEAIIGKTKCHKSEGVNIESCLMAKKVYLLLLLF